MTDNRTELDRRTSYEEGLRDALLRQEEAIAGFIHAAAQHLTGCAAAPDSTGRTARPSGAAAWPCAEALADAALIAGSLAELQRHTLQLVRILGVVARAPHADGEDARSVRTSPPEKAAPPWVPSAPRKPKPKG